MNENKTKPCVLLLYTPHTGQQWQDKLKENDIDTDLFSPVITHPIPFKYLPKQPDAVVWLSQNAVKYAYTQQSQSNHHVAVGPATAAALSAPAVIPPSPHNSKSLIKYLSSQSAQHIRIIGRRTSCRNEFKEQLPHKVIEYVAVYDQKIGQSPAPEQNYTHIIIGSLNQLESLASHWPEFYHRLREAHCLCHTTKVIKILQQHGYKQATLIHNHTIEHAIDIIKNSLQSGASSIA